MPAFPRPLRHRRFRWLRFVVERLTAAIFVAPHRLPGADVLHDHFSVRLDWRPNGTPVRHQLEIVGESEPNACQGCGQRPLARALRHHQPLNLQLVVPRKLRHDADRLSLALWCD